jgi:hypothetical protein
VIKHFANEGVRSERAVPDGEGGGVSVTSGPVASIPIAADAAIPAALVASNLAKSD